MTYRYGTDPLSGLSYALRQQLKSSEMNNVLDWVRGLDTAQQLQVIENWPWSFATVSSSDKARAATFFSTIKRWIVVGIQNAGAASAVWDFRCPGDTSALLSPTDIGELSSVASNTTIAVAGSEDTGATAQKILTRPTSTTTWTARNLSGSTTEGIKSICWDSTNSLFIAVFTGDKIETSPDGITWTNRSTSGSGFDFQSVVSNGSIIVAGCSGPATSFDTSTNGTTWTARTVPSGNYYSVVYHTGWARWFASTLSTIITSTDGTTWTASAATHPDSGNAMKMVAFGDYIVASVGDSGLGHRIMVSDDECHTWTLIHHTRTQVAADNFIASSGDQLCAGTGDDIVFSIKSPTAL